ncbi:MAG: hypothetical protein U5M51_14740 [Emticicia sp.]|nr:hypothetical protein [Emticicia sp.]
MIEIKAHKSSNTLRNFLDEKFLTYKDLNFILNANEINANVLDDLVFRNYPYLASQKSKLIDDIKLEKALFIANAIFFISSKTAEGEVLYFPQKSENSNIPFVICSQDAFNQQVIEYINETGQTITVIKIEKNIPINLNTIEFVVADICESHPQIKNNLKDIFYTDFEKEEKKKALKKQVYADILNLLEPIIDEKPISLKELVDKLNLHGITVTIVNNDLVLWKENHAVKFETFVFDKSVGEEPFTFDKLETFFKANAAAHSSNFIELLKSGNYDQTSLLLGVSEKEFQTNFLVDEKNHDDFNNDDRVEDPAITDMSDEPLIEQDNFPPTVFDEPKYDFDADELAFDQQQLTNATRLSNPSLLHLQGYATVE